MWRIREWLALLSPHAWWYSWRRAAHVVRVTEAEAVDRTFYGSLSLEDEREFLTTVPGPQWTIWAGDGVELGEPPAFLPAPPEVAHDWREQTFTDLAPEALAACDDPLTIVPGPVFDELLASLDDSGPGMVVPGGPGPDPWWLEDLGPNAARVLADWQARFTERWGCRLPAEAAA